MLSGHECFDGCDCGMFQAKCYLYCAEEWICDNWAKAEGDMLNYLRHHQAQLRSELYQSVEDAVAVDNQDPCQIGQRIVLPSSFSGSPRDIVQRYQVP